LSEHTDADRYAWERPGAHEEAPGVYRIPLPLPGDYLKAVNVYAVLDGDQLVMIDGGQSLPGSQPALEQALTQIGFGLRDIREFLVTHIHRDHYTHAIAIRRSLGTRVSLGEGERVAIETLRGLRESPDLAALLDAGAAGLVPQLSDWERREMGDYEDPDGWLTDGSKLPLQTRQLRVIATPGHTRGHVVYHDPDANVLFAGDHVLPHITPSIGVEIPRNRLPNSPLRAYLGSLQLVKALPDARLLPAHGPAGGSSHARIDELLAHHERRLEQTAAALDRGASTGYEVAQILTWTRRERSLSDLDLFNQVLAIHETMAHLAVLTERGVTRYERTRNGLHFQRVTGAATR
jgi:glyoxylase-like metal-dependent hydrolase (beta-lactamase superfamily II)